MTIDSTEWRGNIRSRKRSQECAQAPVLHVEIRTFWGEDRTIPDLFIALNLRDITDSLGFDCGMLSLARRYGQRLVIRVRRLPLKLDYPNKDKQVVHGPDPLIVGVPSQVIEKDRHLWG